MQSMNKNQPVDTMDIHPTKVLKNGAVYDMVTKRIVSNPGGGHAAITKETSSEMRARAQEKKRELLQAAAADAVERGDLRQLHGKDAWIVEIGQAMQRKATNIEDPKMVDAARFLFQETGLSDKQAQEQTAQTVTHTIDPEVVRLLAQIQAMQAENGFDNSNYQQHEIIDAVASDSDKAQHYDTGA
jgi:hypothetical protein